VAVAEQRDRERSEAAGIERLRPEGDEHLGDGHGAEHPAVPQVLLRCRADRRHTQVSISTELIGWEIFGTVNKGGLIAA